MLFGSQVYRQMSKPGPSSIRGAALFLDPCSTKPADFVAPLSARWVSSLSRLLTCADSSSGFAVVPFPACSAYSPVPLTLPSFCLCPSAVLSRTHMSLITLTTVNASRELLSHTLAHTQSHPHTHALHDTLSLKAKLSSALSTVRQALPWQQCDI